MHILLSVHKADSLIAGGNYVHTFLSGDVNGIIKMVLKVQLQHVLMLLTQ
ncbi:MAG: hypothetical protein CM15mV5_2590 [uncultured marine virus]|nr:MAG: hypothetical protein CM15mV5_2590 [uncultured marine virus]